MDLGGHTVLFGGSFNPPHMGHQMACLYLLEALGASAVWLIPAVRHPFGKALADFTHRRAMCQLVAAPFGDRVEVCAVEAEEGASGRTFDTVTSLVHHFPQRVFALAVGADITGETQQWYRWADLNELVPVVVLGRTGYVASTVTSFELPAVASGTIRRQLRQGHAIKGLVPVAVDAYIAAERLYRG